ncbi:SDR family NAD(P)-dependent oxidoreductase [Streptomyces sp. LP05-1]|uniref:SDR family NAD(P)-dependent oxidoreductase n=1 Tax=Streptomyces pyxinae TaxID=2970734 RepID=A0ABT2CGB9_9ACTN|nr:type I polyketide synthase [Streptomyces sp. LP05-1]MCS0635746.1 SDR family NAD(P)-dependent oxidoreductase [Streptomyces sp. LP05-1]
MTRVVSSELVIGITPFGLPDAGLAASVSRCGGLGVLDLGAGDRTARAALARLRELAAEGTYGIRVGPHCALRPDELDGRMPAVVVLAAGSPWQPSQLPEHCMVLAEVGHPDEALRLAADGADGFLARGGECGGRAGGTSTFVLLQALLADADLAECPVWAWGGIGPRTAAAAVAGGAAGVVLDIQLALLAESRLPEETAAVLRTVDGSETAVVDGIRSLRPGRPGAGLPAGQDAFLAARFAEEYGTVPRAVAAVRDAALRGAGDARALAPGSPMSQALGTRLPLAQGPMTRVSDQPAFAAAVARDGALPFLALALLDGDATAELLGRTGAALDGRPWGVGILGFADSALRAAQLAAVRAARPTHAVVAGGRPGQAAELEAAGISTFLHVPSPALLRQYIDAGARKFVFEGAECGGHIGPRNSFPLWEAQLAVLEQRPEAPEFQVLLAGGIHDERSAAMAAALAAPLAGRGAAVGLLMGTAYLTTAEAVSCGAVGESFQRQILDATGTVLLESAPGHVTRCVPSPYTDEYAAVRARLAADGVPDREAWDRLERLNLGRLRIASKGLERQDGRLRPVDDRRRREAGMFMAGEVAALRTRTTTVADLHRAVTEGATAHARRRAAELRVPRETPAGEAARPAAPLDIAVVGMACVFPQAPDLGTYWSHVVTGYDAVTEVPAERWDPATYHDPSGERPDTTPSRWGGFLPRIPFDPLAYGIPPASLAAIEPVQLLALETAARALADAGYDRRDFPRERTGVVFGAESGSDLAHATTLRAVLPSYLETVPAALEEQLPRLTEDSFPGMLANVISGRVANRLDLGGANYTVDAACASSLAALDAACKELASGSADMMLCGGADLHNDINDYLLFSSVRALSPTGRSRSFDADADGTVLGEGVACVVLKRLADAERDGDRIYGVVKGVGSASDGRSLGLTAPRAEGQRSALDRAYASAGISPAEVGLVEAHGTGTVVGDRTELGVLTALFTESGAEPGRCTLGSVKSQIGHTKCAAGLAGLIKAVMALHTGVLPPTLHLRTPNPVWDEGTSPFVFRSESCPWPVPTGRRVAGVSAFGFGGTNFHVVLSGYENGAPPEHGLPVWPAELLTFRGEDHEAARREIRRLFEELEADIGASLRDIARKTWRRTENRHGPVRIAVVATDADELPGQLKRALEGVPAPAEGVFVAAPDTAGQGGVSRDAAEPDPVSRGTASRDAADREAEGRDPAGGDAADREAEGRDPAGPDAAHREAEGRDPAGPDAADREAEGRDPAGGNAAGARGPGAAGPGKVAFLFPGQGSQRPGMLAPLMTAFPAERGLLLAGHAYADALYPPAAFDPAGAARQRATLTDTRIAQPALGIAALTAHQLLERCGVRPDMAAGHSYGELVAFAAAGTLDARTLLDLSAERAASILVVTGDDPGTMAAVAAAPDEVAAVLAAAGLDGDVVVANRNAPRQSVISGPRALVARAVGHLADAGHPARNLPVACAFHSPVVADAAPRFAEVLARHRLRAPEFDVWSNRTATVHAPDPDAVRTELAAQLAAPVRFSEEIEAMYEAGARIFVEAGPGSVLTTLVGRILGDRPHLAVACEPRPDAGLRGFLETLARLAVAGVPVRVGRLFEGRVPDAPNTPAGTSGSGVRPAGPGWLVDGRQVRTAAGAPLPGGLAPARRISLEAPTVTPDPTSQDPGTAAGRADALISDFLRTTRELVAAQRDVLLTYLGGGVSGRLPAPPPSPAARPVPAVVAPPLPRAPEPGSAEPVPEPPAGDLTAASPASGPRPAAPDVRGTVLAVISERTGYPVDMIGDDLELEADLGIDSIKRTEIAGELARRLAAGRAADDDWTEELSRARTVAAITAWLTGDQGAERAEGAAGVRTGSSPVYGSGPDRTEETTGAATAAAPAAGSASAAGSAGAAAPALAPTVAAPALAPTAPAPALATAPPATAAVPEPAPADDGDQVLAVAPRRFVLRERPLEAARRPAPGALRGTRFALLGAHEVGALLADRLIEAGAEAVIFDPARRLRPGDGPFHGVVHLGAMAPDAAPVLPGAFEVLRAALDLAPARLLCAKRTPGDDEDPGAGLRGLFRSIAREYPRLDARVVELDPSVPVAEQADALLEEACAGDRVPVVLRGRAGRHGLELAETAADSGTRAADGTVGADDLGLDQDAVVVLAGGARGITADIATALAATTRCRIELLGRTQPFTGPEPSGLAAATGLTALRAALATRGTPLARVDAEARAVLAAREVRQTVAELTRLGSRVGYRSLDLRDSTAVNRAVKEIQIEHGRIDAVFCAAGVIEDRLIADKDAASFRRVYDTKVDGARSLLDAVAQLPAAPRLAVLFGSIAAVLGNRGQSDYAAANDALAALGERWARVTGQRALTVHWGPWAPAGTHHGMVTPELARDYARRGIALIDRESGALALLREIARGGRGASTVVHTASGW